MSGGALALALGAAFLHAGWNVLLAGSRDTAAGTGGLLVWGVVLLAPFALVFGDLSADAAPYIAASAALELGYFGCSPGPTAGGRCRSCIRSRAGWLRCWCSSWARLGWGRGWGGLPAWVCSPSAPGCFSSTGPT